MALWKNESTLYSLEELYENVEVLPTEWNVTELEGESSCEFLINKTSKEDVIIRHFAGRSTMEKWVVWDMKNQLVISRFNENLNWLKKWKSEFEIVVYNKGKK